MYDLKALQKKELEILVAIHEACDKLGIEYMIHFGTLIGAVRHKGFIPWDDDIDIVMTLPNYDRFIKEAPSVLPENLIIQYYSTEPNCPNIFAKVRDKNTTFLHKEHIDLDICHGVFIDIFPITKLPEGRKYNKREKRKRYRFDLINGCLDIGYVKATYTGKKLFIGKLINFWFTKTPFKIRDRAKFTAKEEMRKRKLDARGGNNSYNGPFELYTERALYDFEGCKLWGPKDYDGALRYEYRDYMTIPPKEKQVTHAPLFVDLEHGYSMAEIHQMIKEGKIKL